jgi:hypothetical protein
LRRIVVDQSKVADDDRHLPRGVGPAEVERGGLDFVSKMVEACSDRQHGEKGDETDDDEDEATDVF